MDRESNVKCNSHSVNHFVLRRVSCKCSPGSLKTLDVSSQLMFHLESVETAGVLIASRVLTMLIQFSSIFNVSNSRAARAHLGSCESGSSVSSKSRKASQQICAHGKHSSSGPISCVIQENHAKSVIPVFVNSRNKFVM